METLKPYTVILMFPPEDELISSLYDASHIAYVMATDHLAAQHIATREAVESRAVQFPEESDAAYAARREDMLYELEVIATYEGHLRDLSAYPTLESLQKDEATT